MLGGKKIEIFFNNALGGFEIEIFLNDEVDLMQSNTIVTDLKANSAISSVMLIDKEKSADIFLKEFGENVEDMLDTIPYQYL